MNPKLEAYIEEGTAFSADEREIAAIALLHIGSNEQTEIDAAWNEEINCRVDEIISGKVELVDGEETRRMAREKLAARRA